MPTTAAQPVSLSPVPGRQCGECAMCCKLPLIPELNKKADIWCAHCSSHQRCDIYATRPAACQSFFCQFMLNAGLGEEWRPSTAHFLMKNDGDQLFLLVDTDHPDAWRQEPYLSNLTRWSATLQITVSIGPRKLAIFPDHIDDLGDLTDDELVAFIGSSPQRGSHIRAIKIKKSELPAGNTN